MNIELLAVTSASLPLFALFYCLIFALSTNFTGATSTHCHVTILKHFIMIILGLLIYWFYKGG